jgi:hemoglobin
MLPCAARTVVLTAVVILLLARPTSADDTRSLYERLGGYDAICALSSDLVGRFAADPVLKRFFVALNDTRRATVVQRIAEFLVEATGGPTAYIGQDMQTAHRGLRITESDWQIAVRHLLASLDKHKIAGTARQELLETVGALKDDIVQNR